MFHRDDSDTETKIKCWKMLEVARQFQMLKLNSVRNIVTKLLFTSYTVNRLVDLKHTLVLC